MEYVVVDVETGGLDPLRHPLIEVAYVLESGVARAFSLPFNEEECDPEALEVNGWGKRDFAELVSHSEGRGMVERDFTDRMVVCSPAHFDMGFLAAWFSKAGDPVPWGHRDIIDLKSFACGKWGVLSPLRNSLISQMLGIEDTSNHSALDDAIWTYKLFQALLGGEA
jgi:DNA polymerase-3 subunit epsilon